MPKTVLVHGFATGVRMSVFRDRCGPDAGFRGFQALIADGKASVFRWDVPEELSFGQALNPWTYKRIYEREAEQIQGPEVPRRLFDVLVREGITAVVAHSLGCQLVLNLLERYGLPETLHEIIFIQADVPRTVWPSHPTVNAALAEGRLHWQNLSCPWDPTLLLSTLLHGSVRAGLWPAACPGIRNRLVPLWRLPNLHTSSIRDRSVCASLVSRRE